MLVQGLLILIFIIVICCVLTKLGYVKVVSADKTKFDVKFISLWGIDPLINHPVNPHTGNMFLITHDETLKLFELGKTASKAISKTAMYGDVTDLMDHINNHLHVGNIVTSSVLPTPGETTMSIHADIHNSHLSFVTMIAPSSDWFTGFTVNLIENDKWIDKKTIPLYVYVAGTDNNQGFVEEHKPKNNADPISLKSDTSLYPSGKITPIAYAIITKH